VRILIAGLGAIGQRHARNVRAICGDSVELLAYRRRRLRHVITETLQRDDAIDVEAALGIRSFDDLDAALAQRPDAVFVCTPTSQHLDIAQRAADAGCHLFIEKPVSHTLDGVEHLAGTVAAKGLVALVGCQWRFHPGVRKMRQLLQEESAGPPRFAHIIYREYLPDWHPYEDYRMSYAARAELGGGVVLTQIHDYDLAWWLLGAPNRVTASGGHMSDLEIDVEDTIDALLEGGACPVRVQQTFAARPPQRYISVGCEKASYESDLLAPVEGFQRNDMFLAEVRHFIDCVEGKAIPATPLTDGLAVLRVALAVRESARLGRTVEVR
jgi:predicted dehydrogenase